MTPSHLSHSPVYFGMGGKRIPAAAVDVQKFGAKAATMGRENMQTPFVRSSPNVYFTIRINISPLFSFSLSLKYSSSVYDDQFRPSTVAPLFLWECAAIIHSQSKLLVCASMCRSGD